MTSKIPYHKLRIVTNLDGTYKVVEEWGRDKSPKIHGEDLETREAAKTRMQYLKKELGIK